MSDNFVPYSFGGLLPEYLYNGSGGGGGPVKPSVVVGVAPILWKLEVDVADQNRLKFYYSNNNGTTWELKMELNHT